MCADIHARVVETLCFTKAVSFDFYRGILMAALALSRMTTTAIAAASGVAVALGLVAAPPNGSDVMGARFETALVQLRAAVSPYDSATFNTIGTPAAALITSDATTSPMTPVAASSVAAATGDTNVLQNLVIGALAAVAAPFWYIGIPVTLPLSIAVGIGFIEFVNLLPRGFGAGGSINPVAGALLGAVVGVGIYAVGPLAIVGAAIGAIFAPATSATAAATTTASSKRNPAAAAAAKSSTGVSATRPSAQVARANNRVAAPSSSKVSGPQSAAATPLTSRVSYGRSGKAAAARAQTVTH